MQFRLIKMVPLVLVVVVLLCSAISVYSGRVRRSRVQLLEAAGAEPLYYLSGVARNQWQSKALCWVRNNCGIDWFDFVYDLRANNCRLSYREWNSIVQLSELVAIDLSDTQIDDDDLDNLSPLTKLVFVNLKGCKVTDQGVLTFLHCHDKVLVLDLRKTNVTDELVRWLRNRYPRLKIEWET